ncbi:hypothetical protein HYX12_02710 [Candidatus Woesearchaeota archaeon]|nr:hypothetical protein [Candidatus Woesearchaeota archaeon]
MKEVVRVEILYDLEQAIEILKRKETSDYQELEKLSNHAIEDVAAHKDLDLVAVTVLMYSLYKLAQTLSERDYQKIMKGIISAKESLTVRDFGKYNFYIKSLYKTISSCNVKIKQHLNDVMHAARIKKGAVLLEKGLSIGQAAGLMGLSNWDLQVYAGKTTAFEKHKEKIPAKKRLMIALKIFGGASS